jgi:orotate phosphoribosyltransferase-like protein
MMEKPNVNPTALELWNVGKTLRQIGTELSISPWSARWLIEKAERAGHGIARRGMAKKPEPPEPPLAELWRMTNSGTSR